MKTWEEETKLNKTEKMLIAMYIVVSIFNVYILIKTKNMAYISNILLWWTLAFVEYMNIKIRKSKDAIINIQDEHIKTQNDMIDDLFKILNRRTKIIKIEDIVIPPFFSKPNKIKLKNRTEYYNKNKCFEVPVIITESDILVDGYTTYLIAKKEGLSHIEAKVDK